MMNNNGNFDFYDFIIPVFMLLGCTIGILIGVFFISFRIYDLFYFFLFGFGIFVGIIMYLYKQI
ncbi:hypothetical protein B4W69_10270 [Staphylococcus delphini]|nr:hypothetical protein B4W69_10270 [Staphylococcus delphini]